MRVGSAIVKSRPEDGGRQPGEVMGRSAVGSGVEGLERVLLGV